MTAPILQGYLVKQPLRGHLLSSSHRRFFTLTSDTILWYESDNATLPKGWLLLVGARVERRGIGVLVVISGRDELILRPAEKSAKADGAKGAELDAWDTALKRQVSVATSLATLAAGHGNATKSNMPIVGATTASAPSVKTEVEEVRQHQRVSGEQ